MSDGIAALIIQFQTLAVAIRQATDATSTLSSAPALKSISIIAPPDSMSPTDPAAHDAAKIADDIAKHAVSTIATGTTEHVSMLTAAAKQMTDQAATVIAASTTEMVATGTATAVHIAQYIDAAALRFAKIIAGLQTQVGIDRNGDPMSLNPVLAALQQDIVMLYRPPAGQTGFDIFGLKQNIADLTKYIQTWGGTFGRDFDLRSFIDAILASLRTGKPLPAPPSTLSTSSGTSTGSLP